MKLNLLRLGLLSTAWLFALNASAQAIVQIASESGISFFVKSDGSLWRGDVAHKNAKWGELIKRANQERNEHRQPNQAMAQLNAMAGDIMSDNCEPVDLVVSNGVTTVAMNIQADTFFVKNDGSLWAIGNNDGGFLGDGTFDTPDHPIQIVSSGVVAVACGEAFTIFLKDDGSVWGFGDNDDGVLRSGADGDRILHPKQIINGGVVAIAAGYLHTLFIKSDSSLWGMGNNAYGQLGLGTNINHTLVPVEIAASNVVSVAAGARHTLFIKSDGSLWGIGLNDFGQIGDCTTDWLFRPIQIVSNNVVAVTAGYEGSLFLKKDGSMWGMGINWHSDYGEGIQFSSECPTQIFGANNSALVAEYYYNAKFKCCASIWADNFNNNNQPNRSVAASKAKSVSSGVSPPGYNLITIELLKDGNVRLTYLGNAGVNYALDRSTSLTSPNWLPQVTNTAPVGGVLVITNTPDPNSNNFWRIRSVP